MCRALRRGGPLRAGLLLLAPSLLGCATLVTGSVQRVRIETSPPGARVVLDDRVHLRAPTEIEVDKLRRHRLRVEKEGYRPVERTLPRRVQPWVLGNVFVLILPGLLVDFLTGGAYALPRVFRVRLEPVERPAPPPPSTPLEGERLEPPPAALPPQRVD